MYSPLNLLHPKENNHFSVLLRTIWLAIKFTDNHSKKKEKYITQTVHKNNIRIKKDGERGKTNTETQTD